MSDKLKTLLKYAFTVGFALVIALIILLAQNTFSQTRLRIIYRDLSDACFVPGIILFGFGLIILGSNEGIFDMLAFSVYKLATLFKKDVKDVKYYTFYDYKEAKKDRRRSYLHFVLVGLFFVGLGALFLVLYGKA